MQLNQQQDKREEVIKRAEREVENNLETHLIQDIPHLLAE